MQPQPRSMSRPQTFPQSPEVLDAVLGRFQEWTASHKPNGGHGLREVSYEDAVIASRRRWQPAKQRTGNNRLKTEPGVIPAEAPAATQAVPAQASKAHAPKRRKQQPATAKPARQTKLERAAAENAGLAQPGKAQPRPAFKTLLAEAIAPEAPAVALTHSHHVEAEKHVTLSLRLAPGEQAMIRARAAAAGISTSAYLRQCALEVEQLREQMRQTLALIGHSAAIAVSTQTQIQPSPLQDPQPGFFERLKQVFFGGGQTRKLSLSA